MKIPGQIPQLPQGEIPKQLPAGEPLPLDEQLKRRSEEADTNAFFQGENVSNRPTSGDENQVLGALVENAIKEGKVKVVTIPGLFNKTSESEGEEPKASE